jgi:hypothetical protein
MPRLTNTRTTLLVKASLLLYCPLVIKLAYGYTISLVINTIVSIPRITASWITSVRTVTSSKRPLRYTKRTAASVLR